MTEPHLYRVEDGWIEIYPGDQFHFGGPLPGEIKVESIAHSLSQLCRYNGHTRRFYSVIEHVCLMSDWVMDNGGSALMGLTALHHDDAEYIIGDLARPIKVTLPGFKALEQILDRRIAETFGTIFPLPGWLKNIDSRILKDERHAVMVPSEYDWSADVLEKLGVRFWTWTGRWPWLTKRRFLRRHRRLTAMVAAERAGLLPSDY